MNKKITIPEMYTVYRHISPSGKVYIGITKLKVKDRWSNGGGYKRCPVFYRAIKKYGWDKIEHEILLENRSESEAKYAEKYLIRWYKLHKMSYNMTDGGDARCSVSEETKEKLRKLYVGIKRGPHSEERIRKIKEGLPEISVHCKPVLQFDLDGNFIKEYISATEAGKQLSLDPSSISKVCRGKLNKTGNFKWKYKN